LLTTALRKMTRPQLPSVTFGFFGFARFSSYSAAHWATVVACWLLAGPESATKAGRADRTVLSTAELVLLTFGLFSRTTAFILSGELAFAYWIGHAPRGFLPLVNAGELAALYCFVFLYLAAAGPGPWSVDRLLSNREEKPGQSRVRTRSHSDRLE
jgi:uncharacterized membrane protein YphA (DoxX/SURF4 family)